MNCYICDINSGDENHCETCRFEVYPIQEWMEEATGDPMWTGSNIPFLEINKDHSKMISGFIAGGQMPFKLIDIGAGLGCLTRLVRADVPEFTYLPFKMVK